MGKETELTLELLNKGYDDVLKPAAQEVGEFLGSFFGILNWLVMPLTKLNIYRKAKLKKFAENVENKLLKVPIKNRQQASINILGPALEALKYNFDEEELKEMFENIIVNAMDNRTSDKCHPAYVDVIRQMSNKDAILLKALRNQTRGVRPLIMPKCQTTINYNNQTKHGYIGDDEFPDYHIGSFEGLTTLEASKSLTSLQRLGLLNIDKIRSVVNTIDFPGMQDPYKNLFESAEIDEIYKSVSKQIPGTKLIQDKALFEFTEFGIDFVSTCVVKNKISQTKNIP